MAAPSIAKVRLKLLVDTKENRVLFAEAGKDFVDFLFSLLQLPIGTVVRLLTEQTMVGSLGNLNESVQSLKETCFKSDQTKESLLNPKVPFSATQVPLLSLHDSTSSAPANEEAETGEGVFVKGEETYMVMDDLVVTPMSSGAWVTMLKKFNVKESAALEEKFVDFGMPEGLKLLEASLHSKKVLTSVFPQRDRRRCLTPITYKIVLHESFQS